MEYCIYKHTFPNGKVYIGQTSSGDPNKRWHDGKGYLGQSRIGKAILKYGWENILHEVIEDGIPEASVNERERYYILKYHAETDGYNSTATSNPTHYQREEQLPTPLKAIRKHCIECCCNQLAEVRRCSLTKCALYPYRMGKRPSDCGEQAKGE